MTTTTFEQRSRLVLADLVPGAAVTSIGLVAGGAALTGAAAQVVVHTSLTPVPFTLQTLSVLLVGAALGPIRGSLSMLVYVAVGALGVPWFAGHGSGWGGASFGYLIGFILAAAVAGALAQRGADRKVTGTVLLMVLGNLAVYAVGATWLGFALDVDAVTAIKLGVVPFLISDGLKIAVATSLLPGTWKLVQRADRQR